MLIKYHGSFKKAVNTGTDLSPKFSLSLSFNNFVLQGALGLSYKLFSEQEYMDKWTVKLKVMHNSVISACFPPWTKRCFSGLSKISVSEGTDKDVGSYPLHSFRAGKPLKAAALLSALVGNQFGLCAAPHLNPHLEDEESGVPEGRREGPGTATPAWIHCSKQSDQQKKTLLISKVLYIYKYINVCMVWLLELTCTGPGVGLWWSWWVSSNSGYSLIRRRQQTKDRGILQAWGGSSHGSAFCILCSPGTAWIWCQD